MKEIHPMFDKLHFTFEETVPNNLDHLPPLHPIFNDIWRRIDEYPDKHFIYKVFKEEENKEKGLLKTYDTLLKLRELDDKHNILDRMMVKYNNKYYDNVITGKISYEEATTEFFAKDFFQIFQDIITEDDADIIYIFNGDPTFDRKTLEEKLGQIENKVQSMKKYSFAQAIYDKYLKDQKNNGIHLELEIEVRNIIKDKNRIESNYDNIIINDQPPIFYINANSRKDDKVKMEVCKILEKHFNLIKNPKDGMYYISDGQGKYIPFDETTSRYTYEPLREQFILKHNNKNEDEEEIIWSKNSFFRIPEQYGIQESEVESNVVGFRNCYLNFKERKIYELDHRFPHLPIKQLSKNFVYSHKLDGGALETILNECFTEENRNIIFQYFGRAIFEKGYVQSQDVVFFMGAGNLGKTTFINSLAQIFQNVPLIEANKFDVDNQFAFAEIPGSDFVIIDEVQSMKNKSKFTEKIKQFTGGSTTIPIERKNKNIFQLPAEYIPKIMGIGNNLPDTVYEKFAGKGVIRRFCIIFAKRSILEAKRMTTIIDDIEYPITKEGHIIGLSDEEREYDEDGELTGLLYDQHFQPIEDDDGEQIIGIQGRTKFNQDELTQDGCLEWFIQQIILNYQEDGGSLLPIEEAKKRAFMTNSPEVWSIARNFEVIRDEYGIDLSEGIPAQEVFNVIKKDIDDHLLEHTIDGTNRLLEDAIKKALDIDVDFVEYRGNTLYYNGITKLDEVREVDIDNLR